MDEDKIIITKKILQDYLMFLELGKREFPVCVGQEFLIEVVKMAIDSFES